MESNRSKYILAGLTAFCILLIGITSLKDGIPYWRGILSDPYTVRCQ